MSGRAGDKTVYVILFRGVGGKTQLPVKPLRDKLAQAGFERVATYINSGNVVLKSALPRARVVAAVADVCAREFGFDKAVYALTRREWAALVAGNPFPEVEQGNMLHAAILSGEPPAGAVEKLRAVAVDGERIAVAGGVAYRHTPHGFGRSKMAERFDRDIGVANTARNWNTVLKLAELADEAAAA